MGNLIKALKEVFPTLEEKMISSLSNILSVLAEREVISYKEAKRLANNADELLLFAFEERLVGPF